MSETNLKDRYYFHKSRWKICNRHLVSTMQEWYNKNYSYSSYLLSTVFTLGFMLILLCFFLGTKMNVSVTSMSKEENHRMGITFMYYQMLKYCTDEGIHVDGASDKLSGDVINFSDIPTSALNNLEADTTRIRVKFEISDFSGLIGKYSVLYKKPWNHSSNRSSNTYLSKLVLEFMNSDRAVQMFYRVYN